MLDLALDARTALAQRALDARTELGEERRGERIAGLASQVGDPHRATGLGRQGEQVQVLLGDIVGESEDAVAKANDRVTRAQEVTSAVSTVAARSRSAP